jgi:DNA-binding response OmpR family regulator
MKWKPLRQHRRHILVIDDDDATRNFVKTTLEKAGYAVTTCAGGREAVSSFREQRYSLVITDIAMPGIDGIDAIKLLRQENATVPIIAMSGVERSLSLLKMADYFTADVTLQKPFGSSRILETVKDVFKKAG